jgi:COMPASS component SPP1
LFFKNAVGRHTKRKSESGITGKRAKRKVNKDADGDANVDEDEDEPSPLGGVLRTRDLKALAHSSEDIESFRKLGSGVLSPPATASPTKASFSDSQQLSNGVTHPVPNGTMLAPSIPLNRAETEHLSALNVEKIGLQSRLTLLKDREKFVSLTRDQAARYAEREGLKLKEVCGYDHRLAWSETEFAAWRASKIGKTSLKHNTLEPSNEDVKAESGDEDVSGAEEDANSTLCTKKRCARHNQWQKINLQDARLEEVEVFESIKRVEQEEKEVRERAMLRARADAAAKKIDAVHGRRAEGWVERVRA